MMQMFFDWVENIAGKERKKCWLPAFSKLPKKFSKGFFPRVIKCHHLADKGLHNTMIAAGKLHFCTLSNKKPQLLNQCKNTFDAI